jgi:hypothetical protein
MDGYSDKRYLFVQWVGSHLPSTLIVLGVDLDWFMFDTS